jgi:hypothetical protein
MTTKTMLFGAIGRQVTVPYPESGMAVVNTLKAETTDLLSGELSVYRPPVTYKTYNMSWKGGSAALQPLLDVHSGVYGPGPFYLTDPVAGLQGNNLLPSKWASSYLLSHVCNGWGSPTVTAQNTTPEGNQATFTQQVGDAVEFPVPIVVPTIPLQPLYYKAWGSSTAVASVAAPVITLGSVGAGAWVSAGTWYWKVTAINNQGETVGSNEVSATLTTAQSQALNWALPTGATGIKVYRGPSAGGENVLVATLGAVTTYTDTGTVGTAATVPASNTTAGTAAAMRVYRYTQATMAWTLGFTIAPTLTNDAPTALVSPTDAAAGTYSAVKLVPYLPAGSTLTLQHIDLAANDYTLLANKFRFGKGIGPVSFSGNATGSLDSATIDRIGLSLDVSEVNRDPNN